MVDAMVAGAGVDLAVREFGGTGAAVLLLHGAGNTLLDMAPLASFLVPRHRVVGMDLRNHGRSGDGPWDWDAVLQDVHAVVVACGLVKPLVVGHSLGGMVATMYAARYDSVLGAVNLDGFGDGTPLPEDLTEDEAARLQSLLRTAGDAVIRELGRPRSESGLAVEREAWVAGAQLLGLDEALAAEAYDRKLMPVASGTFTVRPTSDRLEEIRAAVEQLDLLPLYRDASTPQLVFAALQGGQGLPEELSALAAARARGQRRELRLIGQQRDHVTVVEIEASHALIYECPEQLAQRISEFADTMAAPARVEA